MGTVYLAEDSRLHRAVALKTLKAELAQKPGARERFLREARSAAALEHDHVVPIYYVGEADGIPFLAMPVLKGMSLDNLIRRRTTPLAIPQAVRIARQIAAGLAAAHAHGLIHRDIKPANIWIEPEAGGRVKILDFGLARADADADHLTASGAIVGTPAYMAPEQARGLPVDQRADLFSLGCVLYQMVTGRRPFIGSDTMAVLTSLAVDTPAAPHALNPLCPPELSALTMQLLEKDPARRPACANEVQRRLAQLVTSAAQPSAAPQEATVELSENRLRSDEASATATTRVADVLASLCKPRRRLPIVIGAGLLALFVGGVLLQQLIIRITDRKGNAREIEVKPGEKIEIVQQPGQKQNPNVPARAGDPDRAAAEYVLSVGGKVRIDDHEADILTAAGLPKTTFKLTWVDLRSNPKASDAGLAHFQGCKSLKGLGLCHTPVTDAGLAHFQGCQALTHLDLSYMRIKDAGLAHFQGCKRLMLLRLNHTQVTNVGLAYFQGCKALMHLKLHDTQLTDAGLAHFQCCKGLEYLDLSNTQVTDAGLAHFQGCKNLSFLILNSTRVSDAGLAHFQGCKELIRLELSATKVTDAGLTHFRGCKRLAKLSLDFTRVTDAGLEVILGFPRLGELGVRRTRISRHGFEQLKTALPKCTIGWSEPNRSAAELVLDLGGTVHVAAPGKEARPLKQGDALPRTYFQLRRVSLKGIKKPLHEVAETLTLLRFPETDRLEAIDLAAAGPLDLAVLAPISGLQELNLAQRTLDDGFLAALKGLRLRRLVFDGNSIRGPGLTVLQELPELTDLSLACPTLTNLGVKNLGTLKQLKRLSLATSGVDDDGLTHLEALTHLTELDLRQTKVTATGVARLQKALPKCKIVSGDDGPVPKR